MMRHNRSDTSDVNGPIVVAKHTLLAILHVLNDVGAYTQDKMAAPSGRLRAGYSWNRAKCEHAWNIPRIDASSSLMLGSNVARYAAETSPTGVNIATLE
jgi:hypothetical protein|tara:strand:+ start:11890 stop:12186 length:297 start_codon:yes stop_codon:yes gene_type:complete